MTTDPRITDIEYRLTQIEENIRALTGMVESLVGRSVEPSPNRARERDRLTPAELDAMPTWARVKDGVGDTWDHGDDGKWYRRVTKEAPPISAHMSSTLTMLHGPIYRTDEVVERPIPWTFEALEALPIGWVLRDRHSDEWVKTELTDDVDGTSLWRCDQLDLTCNSWSLPYWLNPVAAWDARRYDAWLRVMDRLARQD